MSKKNYLTGLIQSTWRIVKTELSLFRRFPKLGLAVLAIALVPAAYALIYLSSVWDPNAKTNELPVGIVNLDEGFNHQGRQTNVGAELTAGLIKAATFGFRTLDDAQEARQAVRLGSLAFAVIIPKDFSASAVPGVQPGAGKVTVVLSEGNNYAAAGFARRFAMELGHQVNEALNEKRWEQVLVSVDGSGKSLLKLKAGVAQLRSGANALNEGVVRYSGTAAQLSTGFKQVGSGLRTMETRLPSEADLKTLKTGTQRLALRQREMGTGLEQLQAGARKLTEGASQMQEETSGIPFVGEKIAAGAGQLAAGGTQLATGLATALDANARLTRGADRVEAGTEKLVDGLGALSEGIHTMAEKLPEDNRLDVFMASGKDLATGAAKLRAGVELIDKVLPTSPEKLGGSARGLADSVEPALEVLAPVANNGSAFAPNMVAMALWLGAVMAVYLFNMRVLLAEHAPAPPLAKALGKFVVPALIVLVQTLLTFLVLVFGLGIAVPSYLTFALSMVGAALAFLAIAYLLLRAFGDAGKLFAVLLLTLQLAAGGGVMPIELTGDFFQAVHDWLPFTWVIKTFRATLFGAFDNEWMHAWMVVVFSGLVALLLAGVVGRWKTVALADYKPGVEV
jgi:putative membrane protein